MMNLICMWETFLIRLTRFSRVSKGLPLTVTGGGTSPDRMSTPSTFTGTCESYQNLDTQAIQASASANTRYKLWHVPEDEVSFVCARMIGQGHAFCTLRNCTTNHRQDRVCTTIPGEAYVQRNNESSFIWPSVMIDS